MTPRKVTVKQIMVSLSWLGLLASAALFIAIGVLESQYALQYWGKAPVYNGPKKVWAHRGFSQTHPDNSIPAIKAAISRGASGTEIDIFYDELNDRLIVQHDKPTDFTDPSLLNLEAVFKVVPKGHFLWLDFKNLSKLPETSAQKAIDRLFILANAYQLQDHILVESQNPGNLEYAALKKLHTSYWVSPPPGQSWLMQELNFLRIKWYSVRYGHVGISMHHHEYTPLVARKLNRNHIYLFTVNDAETIKNLSRRSTVKIILSDEDYYGYTAHE